ncbi:hypothetical protein QBC42DRAFT_91679 [Cladorrhinum samala]|uniref:Uncharacterized protein n=1 Tax=Cladorrhinum samala TaxID=585594 RepID=A0AAV9HLL5_9PEZI|nr:hypothetical protein QBC42DRAFT_91679 [Cladorrhinum samala]
MSFDWDHQFCLGCDKQTEGLTYCSESCRLADYEKTSPSSPNSGASSPTFPQSKFYVSPAFNFCSSASSTHTLSPSSSHTSLSSLRSTSSSASSTASPSSQQMAEKSAKELRAYARSFESVRLQRRRSY